VKLQILALVIAMCWATPARGQTKTNDLRIVTALSRCRHKKKARKVDPQLLANLLDIELEVGVPKRYRGVAVAKACMETGYQAKLKGDCWGKGGYCYALGIIQLWPWAARGGLDREDPEASVRFFLGRIKLGARVKVPKYCPHIHGTAAKWRVAWVRVNRGPWAKDKAGKRVPRCGGTPHGLVQLRKWQRLRKWRKGARNARLHH